jgi:hypothetical protein
MKWLSRLSALFFGLITLGMIKDFVDKNRILIINSDNEDIEFEEENLRSIKDLKPEDYSKAMDLRGTPTHVCPCGCNIWNVKVIFNDSEIATYFLDMECAQCGSLATAPTPVDFGNE